MKPRQADLPQLRGVYHSCALSLRQIILICLSVETGGSACLPRVCSARYRSPFAIPARRFTGARRRAIIARHASPRRTESRRPDPRARRAILRNVARRHGRRRHQDRRAGAGDDARALGPVCRAAGARYFLGVNRSKRSLALDLKTAAGRRRPPAAAERRRRLHREPQTGQPRQTRVRPTSRRAR